MRLDKKFNPEKLESMQDLTALGISNIIDSETHIIFAEQNPKLQYFIDIAFTRLFKILVQLCPLCIAPMLSTLQNILELVLKQLKMYVIFAKKCSQI
ncbi:MAG: hypothetical protein ACK41T_04655 [Pseudobdellovibrio sp.]